MSVEILDVMTRRDDLRKIDHALPELPRLNYDIQNRIYAYKSREILLRLWTRKQMSPSCGEPLTELMAEQNVRQRTKQLPYMEARSPSSLQPGSTNSSTRHSREDTLLQATRLGKKGDKEEILGDGTDIHHGAVGLGRTLARTNSASST